MLSDVEARRAVEQGEITILRYGEPIPTTEFRGCSIDLTLGNEYYQWKTPKHLYGIRELDLAAVKHDEYVSLLKHVPNADGNGIAIEPHAFILAKTRERLRLSEAVAGFLTGRSSYGRFGISVEFSANLVCPGHNDYIPLQICNHTPYPIMIYPETPICQVVFFHFGSQAETPYNLDRRSKYVGSSSALLPRWYEDANLKARSRRPPRKTLNRGLALNVALLASMFATASLAMVFTLAPVGPQVLYLRALAIPSLAVLALSGLLRLWLLIKDVRSQD
jgi:deoxycytidine triphosphate deaminase